MAAVTDRPADRPKAKSLRPLRALLPFLAPHRWLLAGAMAALLVAAAAMLAMPLALRQLIDHGLAGISVRHGKARSLSGNFKPTRQLSFRPVAIGAAVEVVL